LSCSEDAFSGVDQDPVRCELLEELPKVLAVFLRCSGVHENIVKVCKAEVEVPQDVHEALECLGGVAEAK
jgi:hypothetical protein